MSLQELVKEQDRSWLVDLEALCVPFVAECPWADEDEDEEGTQDSEEDEGDA